MKTLAHPNKDRRVKDHGGLLCADIVLVRFMGHDSFYNVVKIEKGVSIQ